MVNAFRRHDGRRRIIVDNWHSRLLIFNEFRIQNFLAILKGLKKFIVEVYGNLRILRPVFLPVFQRQQTLKLKNPFDDGPRIKRVGARRGFEFLDIIRFDGIESLFKDRVEFIVTLNGVL